MRSGRFTETAAPAAAATAGTAAAEEERDGERYDALLDAVDHLDCVFLRTAESSLLFSKELEELKWPESGGSMMSF